MSRNTGYHGGVSEPSRSLELSPAATAGLLVLFGLSGAVGYAWGGISGGFFSALGVTTAAAVVGFARKIRAADRTRLAQTAPNLTGLAPTQALSVMGAMTGAARSGRFGSELLTTLEALDETLERAPQAALDALGPLVQEHPRSPAVHLRFARAHQAKDDLELATDSASTSIRLALDGGMNPMAASIFVELDALRDDMNLEDRHWRTLSKALRLRGHAAEAAWCEQRAG